MKEAQWRSVIRIFAVVAALVGLAFIVNELVENASGGGRIHTSTMLWGLTMFAFGLLVLQKGDVSVSLREVVQSGGVVREWFRKGRATDPAGTRVITTVAEPGADDGETDAAKDETVERPAYKPEGVR